MAKYKLFTWAGRQFVSETEAKNLKEAKKKFTAAGFMSSEYDASFYIEYEEMEGQKNEKHSN